MDEETRKNLEATYAHVVPAGETPCVWMTAGVLTCWLCDRNLECQACPLDAALRHDAERPLQAAPRRHPVVPVGLEGSAVLPAVSQPREAAPARALEDLWSGELEPLDPSALYGRSHTWVRSEPDGRVRIGLDPFAARIVGRLRCVVLAPLGTRLRKGKPCAWLDQHGGTLTLLAPISGQVVECNENLGQRAEFELRDPLHGEWLLVLQPHRLRTESRELLSADGFGPLLRQDLDAWRTSVQASIDAGSGPVGRTLADGGVTVRDLTELLGSSGLHRLAARFLGATPLVRTKDSAGR